MKPGLGRMLAGLALAAVAGLISLATYSAAGPGDSYVVWTGGMAIGGFWAVGGMYRWIRYEAAVRRLGGSPYRY